MEEIKYRGYQAAQLFGRIWDTESPKAVLLIVHGIGEHCGRYSGMAEYFQAQGIAVLAFDNRGHGLSDGKRGFILQWEEFLEDLKSTVNIVADRYPTVPMFILGHSLGGTIALDYVQKADIPPRGVLISAPALGTPGLSPVLIAVAKAMSKFAPGFIVNLGLDSEGISRDPEECRKYRDDPLVHGKACVRISTELSAVQEQIFSRADEFPVPLLITYGEKDSIAPRKPIEDFFEAAGVGDKVLKIFEGGFHEVHNDIIQQDVYQLYSEWILART